MDLVSVPAHFDGEHIRLDEPLELERNARLIVTVVTEPDDERAAWHRLSLQGLADAYGPDEEDYSPSLIMEANPAYEGR